ncbi:MAG: glycosyl transferase family 1 [Anaerolineales bacterium]|nr:glycosyltransferase family 4 protein [Anaerolineae bacterium]PWB72652.1 MAG: glycosyl transferase family 1 [Anaerolineales bacterium]
MTPSRRIGFISTRFAGTDGVSLETSKWAAVLERLGHECFYFCGQCDRPDGISYVVPEAFYRHPDINAINNEAYQSTWGTLHEGRRKHPEIEELHKDFFSVYIRPSHVTQRIHELRDYFKEELYKFAHRFKLEALIIENASTIPLNIPLGLAITEFIAETGYPVIAHHHDFHWERQRFMNNSVRDYLASAFPPNLPSIRHVVINSIQEQQLASRTGIAAMVIPNVMDFDSPPPPLDDYASTARADLGVGPDQYLILQPTRIIQRKGIEHAIELTRRLGLPAELVISHAAGDEGTDYEKRVREFAAFLNVKVNFESAIVGDARGVTPEGRKIYTLEDVYPQADLVTYPSAIEGFGNAFLEAIYYKCPIVVNNYSIYEADIKPKGFKVVEFDGYISERTLEETRYVLKHPDVSAEEAEHNFKLAQRYYSYTMLEKRLHLLLANCFGENV